MDPTNFVTIASSSHLEIANNLVGSVNTLLQFNTEITVVGILT